MTFAKFDRYVDRHARSFTERLQSLCRMPSVAARGAANSKGDLIARLAAVEAYQKTFGKLPVTLRFLVEGEDGLGSPSLYRFTTENAELLKANGCLWDEGSSDTKE